MSLKEDICNLNPIYTEVVKCLLDWFDSKKIKIDIISVNAVLYAENSARIAIFYPNEDYKTPTWSVQISYGDNDLSPIIELADPNLFDQIEYWINAFKKADAR